MHTVSETHAFRRAAAEAGMSEDEIARLVDLVAWNPSAGDEMAGTGGCRKVRLPGKGKGKSGGYRTITFFTGPDLPVFLITVFAKGDRANLTKAERNGLAQLPKALVTEYRKKVVKVGQAS
jgi:hypothetical protein